MESVFYCFESVVFREHIVKFEFTRWLSAPAKLHCVVGAKH